MVNEPPGGLVEDCKGGKVMLFAGPGLAASADLPTAQQLLYHVLSEVGPSKRVEDLRAQIDSVEPSLIADVLQSRLDAGELTRLLERSLRVEDVPGLFLLLSKIPFAGVITTLWGEVLDRAFANRAPFVIGPNTTSFAPILRAQRFFLLKVYGDLGEPGRVPFSFQEQFREVVYRNPDYRRFVSSVVANGTLLFLDTSPEEIRDFLGAIESRSRSERTHYALVPSNKNTALEQERMDALYNVTLLPYEAGRRTRELERFVRRLSFIVHERVRPVLRPEVLDEVTLKNIGPFADLRLPLNNSWNVLLSDNGSGKSTVLRAIALALCGDDQRAAYAATSLLRLGTTEGSIELRAGKSRYRTSLMRDENNRVLVTPDAITPVQAGAWLALGFPPFRGVSYSKINGPSKEYEGVPNPVVEDLLPLIGPSGVDCRLDDLRQWMVNASFSAELDMARDGSSRPARRLDSFFKIVQRLIPGLPFKFRGIDQDTWETMVETEDGEIPVQRLSQGITSLLTWVGTLLERLYEVYGESQHPESEKALVLLDEIDAHLHPAWKQQVIPLLRAVFPNLQVLATTHSPLIVGNLQPPNASCYRLLRYEGSVTAEPVPVESFRGWRADQILTGPAFGLDSTRGQETRELMEYYSSLLAIREPTEYERIRLAELSEQLERNVPSYQETEEARQAGELVEEWLQERLQGITAEKKEKLVKEAKLYLAGLRTGESDASR
jgi:AAA domain, putative AbiEii toxin, Type IV TA system/AAA domain/SIR2-like domain